ncbi:MAG: hypothetical protein ACKVH6_09295 [Enterobacterales bacterium]
MLINSSNQASRIYQTESNTPTLITNTSTSIKNKDLADKVTISPAALNAENTWKEIANKFDPSNMSYNELTSMVTELHEGGLITSNESLALRAPPSMNFDSNEKFNMIAQAKKSVEFDQSLGNADKNAQLRVRVLDILETIQGLSNDTSHK